jgi:hypothetical protein
VKKTFCAALALLLTLCLSMCLLPSAWAEGESFSLGDEETFDASRGVIVNAENFPDSIFERSSISLISDSSVLPALLISSA